MHRSGQQRGMLFHRNTPTTTAAIRVLRWQPSSSLRMVRSSLYHCWVSVILELAGYTRELYFDRCMYRFSSTSRYKAYTHFSTILHHLSLLIIQDIWDCASIIPSRSIDHCRDTSIGSNTTRHESQSTHYRLLCSVIQ